MNAGESISGSNVSHTPEPPPANESAPSLSQIHPSLSPPSADLFQALFAAAIDAMLIVDDEYHIIAANAAACKLSDRSLKALIGQSGTDFVALTDDNRNHWQQRLQTQSTGGETGIVRRNNTTQTVSYTLTTNIAPQRHLIVMRAIASPSTAAAWQQPRLGDTAISSTPPSMLSPRNKKDLQQALAFEALLKRITDHVRDSLDEGQILQTAVQELTQGLNIYGCDVAIYHLERKTIEIRAESKLKTMPPLQTNTIPMSNDYDLLEQLLRGDTFQFCRIEPLVIRQIERRFTVLNSPIVDHQKVIGGLWLFKHGEQTFSTPEIRLVQQVANQCAIAIRQARLYQAAQAQVTELERLNCLKDDFLSSVSHELRTPVASIKMAAQMLEVLLLRSQTEPTGDETDPIQRSLPPPIFQRIQQYLQILNHECQREIELITNLLDLTRLDARSEPLFPITIDLRIWLLHVIEPFAEVFTKHQQQLSLELPSDLPTVTTDLSYLQRILSELLSNANKYTPAGGTITLAASVVPFDPPAPRSAIRLRVTNTGIEISPQELPHIFDRFYRIPNNDPWRYGGTGLGLALVQKIATKLGATITAESMNDQVTFNLDLPL